MCRSDGQSMWSPSSFAGESYPSRTSSHFRAHFLCKNNGLCWNGSAIFRAQSWVIARSENKEEMFSLMGKNGIESAPEDGAMIRLDITRHGWGACDFRLGSVTTEWNGGLVNSVLLESCGALHASIGS